MKRTTIIAVFIIIALSASVLSQTPEKKSDKDEQAKNEVTALAKEFFKASVEMDAATMERILSDNYTSVESFDSVGFGANTGIPEANTGIPMGKELLVRAFKTPPKDGLRLASIQMDELINNVRVFGDTAVLVTKITLKWQGTKEELAKKYKFMPRSDDFIVTLVAVKKNGTWQIVSQHQSEFRLIGRESKPTR